MTTLKHTAWPSAKLPTDICALILIYEGKIVEDYIRCIVRRMCVRSYKRVLSRKFRFAMLPLMNLRHLCFLVHTQLQTFERSAGVIARNISRVHINPWLPIIRKYKMKSLLHTTALHCIRQLLETTPLTPFRDVWLEWQRDIILIV